ncbi:MAG: hypothetical protein HQL63_13860 [Magnetococcales bacterium]|nr:hypothetical protein [Magnetococcales bacterium]MBF0322415.1 hypothetical protein [Magnetococcales bacterium]
MILPTVEYRLLNLEQPTPPQVGLDGWLHAARGWLEQRRGKTFADRVAAILDEFQGCRSLTEVELSQRLQQQRILLKRTPEARVDAVCPLLLEVVRRQLGTTCGPEMVQVILGLAEGFLVEHFPRTERVLGTVLAAFLATWRGPFCHVLTSNDASALEHARLATVLGTPINLTVGLVRSGMGEEERNRSYACDVTCVAVREAVVDFLRDRQRVGVGRVAERNRLRWLVRPNERPDHLAMRGLATAVVAEADLVMLDAALVPGVLWKHSVDPAFLEAVKVCLSLLSELQNSVDFTINALAGKVTLTASGQDKICASLAGFPPTWRSKPRRIEVMEKVLTVACLLRRERDYRVMEGRVVPVDRAWDPALRQILEVMEGVASSSAPEMEARCAITSFLCSYPRFAGITALACHDRGDYWSLYDKTLLCTHQRFTQPHPIPQRLFATGEEKWRAILEEIASTLAGGKLVWVVVRQPGSAQMLVNLLRARRVAFLSGHTDPRVDMVVNPDGEEKCPPNRQILVAEMLDNQCRVHKLLARETEEEQVGGSFYVSLDEKNVQAHVPAILFSYLTEKYPCYNLLAAAMLRWVQHRTRAIESRRRRIVHKTNTLWE